MIRLFVVADDVTGALDTGVKFAVSGIPTKIITDIKYDFSKMDPSMKVLVMDAGTRHLTLQAAYDTVYDVVRRAVAVGIPFIYKKTDSALRGNIGSELTAALKASGETMLTFLPAYPSMARTTIGGVQYLEGIPIHETVFGQDPFEPVYCSYIPKIIKLQSEIPVRVIKLKEHFKPQKENGICVFDCETREDLYRIASELNNEGVLRIMAGCAGLAGVLPEVLGLRGIPTAEPKLHHPLLVVSGSVNEISQKQLFYAENNGFKRVTLTPEQKLEPAFLDSTEGEVLFQSVRVLCGENSPLIIDTNDMFSKTATVDYARKHNISNEQVRVRITNTLGRILKAVVDAGIESTMLVSGGDILMGFMQQVDCREIIPVYEIESGVVYSQFQYQGKPFQIISKSGGFGNEQLLVSLAEKTKR